MRSILHLFLILILGLAFSCSDSQVHAPAVNANPDDDKTCGDCHGTSVNFAPPKDTLGNSSTTATGVGAHESHLKTGKYRVAVQCNDCHLVPTVVSAVGHLDSDLPAEVIFGELAQIGGFNPTWNGVTCSGVYCHGAALAGGALTSPEWTKVDSTQAYCGSCHGIPPPLPHIQQNDCETCHEDVVDASKKIIDKTLHINGVVDVSNDALTCYSCHGSGSNNNAPPKDTTGHTTTSFKGVGAHQSHMTTTISSNVSCVECHIVPSQITSPGHTDTALPAEITFSSLAKTGNVTPVWNGTTCANTYCHGNFSGGLHVSPVWTTVNGAQAACGTCHTISPPPSTGDHRNSHHINLSCSKCHGVNYSSTSVRIANHINGVKDVGGSGSEIQSWNSTTKSCDPTCHGFKTW